MVERATASDFASSRAFLASLEEGLAGEIGGRTDKLVKMGSGAATGRLARAGSPDQAIVELRDGDQLGRNRLLFSVATGGMARVWAAQRGGDRGVSTVVAVKTILPHLAREPEFERMFLDEARIASGIRHPNVCEVYELGESKGTLFMVLEWVDGGSLMQIVDAAGPDEPLELRVAVRIVADACAGLHAAHELVSDDGEPLGVVHRDVSPHNILITRAGHIKVTDFGVAKALGQMHSATLAGQIKGKVAYMSPEQVAGGHVDRRSDVFGAGCVLYEATTGRTPFFREADHQMMLALVQGDFTRPSELLPGYPLKLEEIVCRALARDPNERFQTALEMRRALQAWLAETGRPVSDNEVAALVKARLGEEIRDRSERIMLARQGVSAPNVAGPDGASPAPLPPAPAPSRHNTHSGVQSHGDPRSEPPPSRARHFAQPPPMRPPAASSPEAFEATMLTPQMPGTMQGPSASAPPPPDSPRAAGPWAAPPPAPAGLLQGHDGPRPFYGGDGPFPNVPTGSHARAISVPDAGAQPLARPPGLGAGATLGSFTFTPTADPRKYWIAAAIGVAIALLLATAGILVHRVSRAGSQSAPSSAAPTDTPQGS